MKPSHTPQSRRFGGSNILGLATLMLGISAVPASASTLAQTFTYDSTVVLIDSSIVGTGDSFYSVTDGSTDPILIAQPFDALLGTLQSFSVSLVLNYEGFQTNGADGSGFSISSGGDITLNGFNWTGTGNGTGNGGAPFSEISAPFPINFSQTFMVTGAGDDYDPAILAAVQGASPFEVRFAHNPSISPATDATAFRLELAEGSQISLTYTFVPIPEPASAALGLIAGLLALTRRRYA